MPREWNGVPLDVLCPRDGVRIRFIGMYYKANLYVVKNGLASAQFGVSSEC